MTATRRAIGIKNAECSGVFLWDGVDWQSLYYKGNNTIKLGCDDGTAVYLSPKSVMLLLALIVRIADFNNSTITFRPVLMTSQSGNGM